MEKELLQKILAELQGMKADISHLKQETNKRFDWMDGRFDMVNRKLDSIETNVNMTFRAVMETHQDVKALLNAQSEQAAAIEKIKNLEH